VLRLRTIQTCRRHYPGGTAGGDDRSIPATMSAFAVRSRLGSRINNFEACSAFTHVTACLVARSPKATLCTEGFDGFVTSTVAPIATGRSDPVAGRDLHPQALNAFARRTSKSVTTGEGLAGLPDGAGAVECGLEMATSPEKLVAMFAAYSVTTGRPLTSSCGCRSGCK